MGAALDVVQQAYAAFGGGDIASVVKVVANEVDWECVAPATLPYAGRRRTPGEVTNFLRPSRRQTTSMPLNHGSSLRLASTLPCWVGKKQLL